MLTRMQHPEHGFMYATDKGDEARLINLGWTPEVKPEEPVAEPEETEEAPKRRGRPPKA